MVRSSVSSEAVEDANDASWEASESLLTCCTVTLVRGLDADVAAGNNGLVTQDVGLPCLLQMQEHYRHLRK